MAMRRAASVAIALVMLLTVFGGVSLLSNTVLASETVGAIPQISSQRAREVAQSHGGYTGAREALLFMDDGRSTFEVDIRNDVLRFMVYIDAINGEVIRFDSFNHYAPGSRIENRQQTTPATRPNIPDTRTQTRTQDSTPNRSTDFDAVAQTALSRAGSGVVRHMCLDWHEGRAVYHVRIYRGGNRVDYYLDRSTLETVRHRERQHNNASSSSGSFQRRQMNITPAITFNRASEIVLEYMAGTVREISRSYIDGRGNTTPVFDVDITTANGEKWCFYVDIHSGEILRYHRE